MLKEWVSLQTEKYQCLKKGTYWLLAYCHENLCPQLAGFVPRFSVHFKHYMRQSDVAKYSYHVLQQCFFFCCFVCVCVCDALLWNCLAQCIQSSLLYHFSQDLNTLEHNKRQGGIVTALLTKAILLLVCFSGFESVVTLSYLERTNVLLLWILHCICGSYQSHCY